MWLLKKLNELVINLTKGIEIFYCKCYNDRVNYYGGLHMKNIKIVPSVEFNDDYVNAKADLIKAMQSISKLSDAQKRFLVEELYGAAYVDALLKIVQNINFKR